MNKKKESIFGELLFRIIILLILFASFKPLAIYIQSIKKSNFNKNQTAAKIIIKEKAPVKIQNSNNNIINKKDSTKKFPATIKKIDKKIEPQPKMLPYNTNNAKKQESVKPEVANAEQINGYVEKINTYIDEQDFLLSTVDPADTQVLPVLKSIENNILEIEQEAREKRVSNLINNTDIDSIKSKIESYKQIVKEI